MGRGSGSSGYTLSEIVVTLAVITILAGSLAPLVAHQVSRARRARALRDIAAIAQAVQAFREDVRAWPDRSGGSSGVLGYLLTAGTAPGGLGGWQGPAGRTAQHLVDNDPPGTDYPETGNTAWRGPYLPNDPTDPWGHAYVLSVAGMRGDSGVRGWILSAGPNGVLETDDGDDAIPAGSDDIGWRLR